VNLGGSTIQHHHHAVSKGISPAPVDHGESEYCAGQCRLSVWLFHGEILESFLWKDMETTTKTPFDEGRAAGSSIPSSRFREIFSSVCDKRLLRAACTDSDYFLLAVTTRSAQHRLLGDSFTKQSGHDERNS
jgi:hypothetical protein